MRITSALHGTLLSVLLAFPISASAQSTAGDHEPDGSPPLAPITAEPRAAAQNRPQTLQEVSDFRSLHNPVISADGAWMAAEERSDRGGENVRVWSTEGDVTFTIERGQNPRISRDSRWVSALQKPLPEDAGTTKATNQRAGQTLVVLDTQDGSRRAFDFVVSYDVTYSSAYLAYLQSQEMKADEETLSKDQATKRTPEDRKAGTLHMVYLKGDNVHTIENVAQHVTHTTHAQHQTVDLVAYVSHNEETGRDTLHIAAFKPGPNSGYRGKHVGHKITGQRWAHDDAILAFLDNTETKGKDGKPRVSSSLHTWNDVAGRSGSRVFTRVDLGDPEFGSLHNPVISADGAWMAAEERSDRGGENVRVWSTEGDVTFTIERGQNPRISRDSRWVSALQKPLPEDAGTTKATNQRAGQTLVVLDTQDGSRRAFDFVVSYDVTYSSSHLAYLQSTEPTVKERKVGTLHMVPLDDAALEPLAFQNVVHYASQGRDQTTDHFAYVVRNEETGRDTLYIATFNRPGSWGIRGTYNGEKIEGLCWARDPITLGFLDSTKTLGNDGKKRVNSALYMWKPAPTDVERFTRVDTAQ